MRCSVCSQEYDQQVKFCPNCGAPQPEAASQGYSDYDQTSQSAYVRPDYDPSRDGQYKAPVTAVPLQGQYVQAMPSSTGQIVFSIINIVCCGGFIGTILGVIALIFAITASSETNYDEAVRKLKTAKTLNIIGICLVILTAIVGIIVFFAMLTTRSFNYFDSY